MGRLNSIRLLERYAKFLSSLALEIYLADVDRQNFTCLSSIPFMIVFCCLIGVLDDDA